MSETEIKQLKRWILEISSIGLGFNIDIDTNRQYKITQEDIDIIVNSIKEMNEDIKSLNKIVDRIKVFQDKLFNVDGSMWLHVYGILNDQSDEEIEVTIKERLENIQNKIRETDIVVYMRNYIDLMRKSGLYSKERWYEEELCNEVLKLRKENEDMKRKIGNINKVKILANNLVDNDTKFKDRIVNYIKDNQKLINPLSLTQISQLKTSKSDLLRISLLDTKQFDSIIDELVLNRIIDKILVQKRTVYLTIDIIGQLKNENLLNTYCIKHGYSNTVSGDCTQCFYVDEEKRT